MPSPPSTATRVFGMPVERLSTGEYTLLVVMVDDKVLTQAIAAVLSVDSHARHPQSD